MLIPQTTMYFEAFGKIIYDQHCGKLGKSWANYKYLQNLIKRFRNQLPCEDCFYSLPQNQNIMINLYSTMCQSHVELYISQQEVLFSVYLS